MEREEGGEVKEAEKANEEAIKVGNICLVEK